MAEISAALVKELRERTGAGMMDCKRALQETNGDMESAIVLLRERGMAQAAKRAGRETTEGKVGYRLADDGRKGTMVAVGCETEPVSNNDEFLAYAKDVLEAVDASGVGAESSLEDRRVELSAKLGENIVVRGIVRYEGEEDDVLAGYVHPPAHKIGVLIHGKGNPDIARLLAQHIAWADPLYLTQEDVPEAELDAEREILSKQPDVASKPEAVRAKIVEGRIQKWLAERVLDDQQWIHDSSKTVGQEMGEAGFSLIEFRRFALAE